MDSITTRPKPSPGAPADADGLTRSPMFFYLTLGLGAALAAVSIAFALTVSGRPPAGKQDTAADVDKKDGDKAADKGKEDGKDKGGRYQIELVNDDKARESLDLGLRSVGFPPREMFVFRYKGGYLECKIECEDGRPTAEPECPPKGYYSQFLTDNESVMKGEPASLNREGYVVLLARDPSPEDFSHPALHPHFGAMFPGLGGPLTGLTPYYHEVWRRNDFRLSVSLQLTPTQGGFSFPTVHSFLIRSHFANDDTRANQRGAKVTVGKYLEAGKEYTLVQRPRGLSNVTLKARFLPDAEAIKLATPIADRGKLEKDAEKP